MKLKQWIKILLISSSVLALVACHSKHKNPNPSDVNDANLAYNGVAQSSGLGEASRFDDQAGSTQVAANKRIYYFDFDSNVVHDADKPAIVAQADRLVARQNAKVMLEGHTDPRGSREYNIGLGERRAKSVAKILTETGVNPRQIRIVSYGAEKLAASGHTEWDYQQDRRAVLNNLR